MPLSSPFERAIHTGFEAVESEVFVLEPVGKKMHWMAKSFVGLALVAVLGVGLCVHQTAVSTNHPKEADVLLAVGMVCFFGSLAGMLLVCAIGAIIGVVNMVRKK